MFTGQNKQDNKSGTPTFNIRYFIATRKFLLLSLGISVGCIFLFFTLTFPQIQSLQEQRQELEMESTTLSQLQSKLSILQNVNTIGAFAQRDQVEALLPSTKPLLPLLYSIDQLSTSNTVVTTEFNISPGEISVASDEAKKRSSEVESKTTDSLQIDLSVVGELTNLNAFLNGLDTLSPLTDVISLSIEPFTNAQSVSIVAKEGVSYFEMRISLETYYYTGSPVVDVQQQLPDIEAFSTTLLPAIANFKSYESSGSTQLNNQVLQQKQSLF